MQKFFQLTLPIVLLLILLPAYHPTEAQAEENLKADGVLVKYKETENKPVSELIEMVDIPKGESADGVIEKLEEKKEVDYAEPNYLFKKMGTPNDPNFIEQWHHKKIHTTSAWKSTMGSSDITVAIIDDGIDKGHEDLTGKIIQPYNAVNDTTVLPKGEHGTHVAGIIAGSANNALGGAGVAPNIKIMPINVFEGEYADIADIIEAIDYAVDKGADIINMSLGEAIYSEALNQAIQEAYNKGVLIVAAAGNDGKHIAIYPAAYNNVVSVSAVGSNNKRPAYSNYDKTVDLAAPGDIILSTLPKNQYGYMSGTSMSAPMVSGVAALIWSKEPKLTKTEVAFRLYDSSYDLGTAGKDSYYGYGLVDAQKALAMKTLKRPAITAISDKDTKIKGTIPTSVTTGTVSIYTNKKLLSTVKINGQKSFTATIAKQKAGTKIYARTIDKAGNKSVPVSITVMDKTPPTMPTINTVGDNSLAVIGKAEAGASVLLTTMGTKLGQAKASSSGNYTIKLKKKQKAGTRLSVSATDQAGNKSAIRRITVKDKTAPATPTVHKITVKTTKVTGKAEAGSTVYAKASKKVLGSAGTSKKGTYSIKISKQKSGKNVYVYAKDKAKNVSKSKKVTVKSK